MKSKIPGALASLLLLWLAQPLAAQPEMAPYTSPQQLVRLPDGRRINLVCMGTGAPAVILTAGAGDWSMSWHAVQAGAARKTRVCGWDPAGFGFSDPSPAAQSAANIAQDLSDALRSANIAPPYVLVAHSAGSYDSLQFAARHRSDVAGFVLVDPSLPDMVERVGAISPRAAALLKADLAGRATAFRHCAANPDQAGAADAAICFHLPSYATASASIFSTRDHEPARLATRASLYEQFADSAHLPAEALHSFGSLPLAVLTSQTEPLAALPVEDPGKTAALDALWRSGHDQLAALSTRGSNRMVEGTDHQIQLNRPDAVIAAINAVVDQERAGR